METEDTERQEGPEGMHPAMGHAGGARTPSRPWIACTAHADGAARPGAGLDAGVDLDLSDALQANLASLTKGQPILVLAAAVATVIDWLRQARGLTGPLGVGIAPIDEGAPQRAAAAQGTVPVVIDVQDGSRFRDLLINARAALIGLRDRRPGNADNDRASQNSKGSELVLVTISLDGFTDRPGDVGQDLHFSLVNGPAGLTGTLHARAGLFRPETAQSYAALFGTVMCRGVADALSQHGKSRQRKADPAAALPQGRDPDLRTLWQRTVGFARSRPDAPALIDEAGIETYDGLVACVQRIASGLPAGLRPEEPVAVILPRGPQQVKAHLAISARGGAYLPIDPSLPTLRIRSILQRCGVRYAVVAEDAGIEGIRCIGFRNLAQRDQQDGAEKPLAGPDQIAYVISTSGSTGAPKAVGLSHRGLASLIDSSFDLLRIGPGGRFLLFASPSFDATIYETANALGNGAALVSPPAGVDRFGPEILRTIRDQKVTHICMPPSALSALELDDKGALETVVSAGEPLGADLARHLQDLGLRVINAYGPAEATVCATAGVVDGLRFAPTIGTALPGLRIAIQDRRQNECDDGMPGELCIAGPAVGRGYVGDPRQTAMRFVPDPHGPPGGRVYRTGDLARRLPDGRIVLHGREDRQVKLRGQRLELAEVEAVLSRVDGIAEAHAIVDDSQGHGMAVLRAFAIPARGLVGNADEVLRQAARSLPPHMVPGRLDFVRSMPRTVSGKIDINALYALAATPTNARRPSGNEIDRVVAAIWSEVLERDVGLDDNFFKVGGHSLLATKLAARMDRATGAAPPIRLVFDAPVLRDYVQGLTKLLQGKAPCDEPRLIAGSASPTRFRATPAQTRIWVLDALDPGAPTYVTPLAIDLDGPLDVDAFRTALDTTVAVHDMLRAAVTSTDGTVWIEIRPPGPVAFDVIETGSEDELEEQTRARIKRGFDLTDPPLIRAAYLTGPGISRLVLTTHHLVIDSVSAAVLIEEIARRYRAHKAAPAPLVKEETVRFADYADWINRRSKTAAAAADCDWHVARFAECEPLRLPFAGPLAPGLRSARGATVRRHLNANTASALAECARTLQVTPFNLLLAVLEALLLRLDPEAGRFAVATPTVQRTDPRTERLMGYCGDTVLVRLGENRTATFRDAARAAQISALASLARTQAPFERVAEALLSGRTVSETAITPVMFAFEDSSAAQAPAELPGRLVPCDTQTSKFDLLFLARVADDGITLELEYACDLFDARIANDLLDYFETLLAEFLSDPDCRIDLARMRDPDDASGDDRTQRGSPAQTMPAFRPVTEHLLEAASRAPDARAVVASGKTLTYAEFLRCAGGVARRLIDHGATQETRVVVLVERGIDAPVATLGTFLSSAAFVPVDATAPKAQISDLVARCDPVAIVASAALSPLVAGLNRPVVDPADVAPAPPPRLHAHSDGLAYVIFTSGSTGRPKGCMGTHGMLCNLIEHDLGSPRLPRDGATAQFSSMAFDVYLQEIFNTCGLAAPLAIPDEIERNDPALLCEFIARHDVTRLYLPNLALQRLTDAAGAKGGFPPCLRFIASAGEQLYLTPDLRRLIRQGGIALENHYGPTETHICISTPVDADTTNARAPIGRPITGCTSHVMTAACREAEDWIQGKLAIGGTGPGRGYLGDPRRTADVFRPDPFSSAQGQRLYMTGDTARKLPQAMLEFLGRTDRQVKVRGYRLEPAALEAVLTDIQGVSGAVVTPEDSPDGSKRLVAFVECSKGMNSRDVRLALQRQVPHYMIPDRIHVTGHLPVLSNAKIDLTRLKGMTDIAGDDETPPKPVGIAAELVAQCWSTVLGLPDVPLNEDFFALGGTSITAAHLAQRLSSVFGRPVPVHLIFVHRTCALLADAMSELHDDDAVRSAPSRAGTVLTPRQRSFLRLHEMFGGSEWLSFGTVVAFAPPLARDRLAAAVASAQARHAMLRTLFPGPDENPRVLPMDAAPPIFETRAFDNPDDADDWVFGPQCKSFKLADVPPIRIRLAVLDSQQRLGAFAHHVGFDAQALETVMIEILREARGLGPDPADRPDFWEYTQRSASLRASVAGKAARSRLIARFSQDRAVCFPRKWQSEPELSLRVHARRQTHEAARFAASAHQAALFPYAHLIERTAAFAAAERGASGPVHIGIHLGAEFPGSEPIGTTDETALLQLDAAPGQDSQAVRDTVLAALGSALHDRHLTAFEDWTSDPTLEPARNAGLVDVFVTFRAQSGDPDPALGMTPVIKFDQTTGEPGVLFDPTVTPVAVDCVMTGDDVTFTAKFHAARFTDADADAMFARLMNCLMADGQGRTS